MTEVKAVFFDLDGTLLTGTRGIAPSTRQAIAELRRRNVLVGIATGRGPAFAMPLLEELGLNFAITFNGQYIIDAKDVLYKNALDKKLVNRIVRYAANNHRDLSFGMADGMTGSGLLRFGESKWAGMIAGMLPQSAANLARNSFKNVVRRFRPVVYDLRELLRKPIYQIVIVATADETAKLEIKFQGLTVTRSNPYSADLISEGTTKLKGIERLGKMFDFKLSEVMAFGDSENDMNMLEGVGTGVAMGNAQPAVKKIANYVTAGNNQDGISKALAHYGLIAPADKDAFVSKDLAFNRVKAFHQLMDGKTQEVPRLFSAIEASHRAAFEVEEIVEFLSAAAATDNARFAELVSQLHLAVDAAVTKIEKKKSVSTDEAEFPEISVKSVKEVAVSQHTTDNTHVKQAATETSAIDLLTAQTDSLIDLLYMTYGSLVLSGVDPYEIFDAVHQANMAKIFPDGRAHFDAETGKVLKPHDWEEKYAPEKRIRRELERQTRVANRKKNEKKD